MKLWKGKNLMASIRARLSSIVNGPYVSGLLVNSDGFKFLVDPNDLLVGRNLRYKGVWAAEEKELIGKLVDESSVVAFIGTHVGSFGIPTASLVKKAIFVEANPNTFFYLDANVKLNNLTNTVCHNVAVGEKDGEIRFVLNKNNSGQSKREPLNKQIMYYYDKPETVTVQMTTFDSLAKDFSDGFDLLVIDIEGSEYFALQGMQDVLARTKSIVIEFYPPYLIDVANITVDDFLSLIVPHFKYCYIPSRKKYLNIEQISTELNAMFKRNEADYGIVFSKSVIAID